MLSDDEKRQRYDRFGSAEGGAQFSGDIFDIFASVFGGGFAAGGGRTSRGQAGEDLETELTITLEQARAGETVPVSVRRLTTCDRCKGDRADPDGSGRTTCGTCGGRGQVRAQAQSLFGTVMTARACPTCHGLGDVIEDPCGRCEGRGRVEETAAIDVDLPRGIDGGYRLRIPRQGNAGVDGGPSGDLYVYIEMEPHGFLRRDGDDLRFELRVGLAQAALGSSFEVPTLDGPEVLEIPAGTQAGREFRLSGKGMPRLRRVGMGDQVVSVRVATPTKLSARARELLEAYAEEVGEEIEEKATLKDRIQGLFGRGRKAGGESDETKVAASDG